MRPEEYARNSNSLNMAALLNAVQLQNKQSEITFILYLFYRRTKRCENNDNKVSFFGAIEL